jgi:hypothetical protein
MIRIILLPGSEAPLFQRNYSECGGFPVDLGYLVQSEMYGIFYRGKQIGGFVLNHKAPFRALNDISVENLQELRAKVDSENTFEAMCFWLLPQYRKGNFSILIWTKLLRFLHTYPRQVLLLSTVSEKLMSIYLTANPNVLYQGNILTADKTLPKYLIAIPDKRRLYLALARNAPRRLLGSIQKSVRAKFNLKESQT